MVSSKTVNINLMCKMETVEGGSFDYKLDVDGAGQIVFTPSDTRTQFTEISEVLEDEHEDATTKSFRLALIASMTSTVDNFSYFCDIDRVGQAVIVPYEEDTSFENVSVEGTQIIVEDSAEETPYTQEELERELAQLTKNFTIEGDTLKCGFDSEKDMSIDILKQRYAHVTVSKVGMWWEIKFFDKILDEDIDPTDKAFEVKKNICETMIADLSKLFADTITKMSRLRREFEVIGISTEGFEDTEKYLEDLLHERSEFNISVIEKRLEDYSNSSTVTESVDNNTVDDSEAQQVIDDFMRGGLTIVITDDVPEGENIIQLEPLTYTDGKGSTFNYYYDRESGVVAMVKEA